MPAPADTPATKEDIATANRQIAALQHRLDESENRYHELRSILVAYQRSHQAAQTVIRQFVDRTYGQSDRREIDKSG